MIKQIVNMFGIGFSTLSIFAIIFILGWASFLHVESYAITYLDGLSYAYGLFIGILYTLIGISIMELIDKVIDKKRKLKKE